ncbi:MAG: TIGR04255 family protein [Dolichospermum sp.]|nr:TIGR04255 family protein [Dolichospermum sp.]
MAVFIKLKNTPIKEIIFTISFNESVTIEQLDTFKALPEIKEQFPIINEGFNTEVQATGNEAPVAKISTDGYMLQCDPSKPRIIQARRGSFSLHNVGRYETFETLINELKDYWSLLRSCVDSLTVNNLSVRYLNFIETKGDIDKLLTIQSKHPFGNDIESNFSQYKFNYDKNNDIITTVITATGRDGDKNGVILDIILNKKIVSGKNIDIIFDSFSDMRAAKNDIFFRSITEYTISKYNS